MPNCIRKEQREIGRERGEVGRDEGKESEGRERRGPRYLKIFLRLTYNAYIGTTTTENSEGITRRVDVDSLPFLLPFFMLSCRYLPHRCCTHSLFPILLGYPLSPEASPVGPRSVNKQLDRLRSVHVESNEKDSHESWSGPNTLGSLVLQSCRGRVPRIP